MTIQLWKFERTLELMLTEIWRKHVRFWSNYQGYYPLFWLSHEMKSSSWRFEGNQSWCWWDMKENVGLSIGYTYSKTLHFDSYLMIMKSSFFQTLITEIQSWQVDEIWRGNNVIFNGVSIGFLPLHFDHLVNMKSSFIQGLKEIGVDVDEIWRKMLGFRVSIGYT